MRVKPRPASSLASWGWLAIPVVALVLVLHYRLASGAGYPLDDSWIHLAFARHLAHGEGFGVNAGQGSTGSTSPLWTLLLVPGLLIGAGHRVWPWLLGMLALAGTGLAAARVVRRLLALRGETEGSWATTAPILGGLLAVTSAGLVWSAAGAMETPLFTLFLLLAWSEQLNDHARASDGGRRLPSWGILAGLATLARPEGLIFVVLLALCARSVRAAILNLVVALAVYAPYGIYCLAQTGRFWPSTLFAKTTRAFAGLPDAGYLLKSLGLIARLMPALVVLLGAGLLLWAIGALATRHPAAPRSGRWVRWRPYLPGTVFPIALPLAYASMGRTFLFAGLAGNFGRYFFPLAPFLALTGLGAVLAGTARWRGRIRGAWLLLAVAGLTGWNAGHAWGQASRFAHNVRDVNAMQVEMARRLARDLPPGSLVAANDVGALAYFTDLRVLDLVGIVSPEVQQVLFPLRQQDRRARHAALFNLLTRMRPAAIVVFPEWYREILTSLEPIRQPLETIRVPDNITAAQDELVAYRLNWSAAPASPGGRP
jgi:hypothetical protein